jgi:hypothetical protein
VLFQEEGTTTLESDRLDQADDVHGRAAIDRQARAS